MAEQLCDMNKMPEGWKKIVEEELRLGEASATRQEEGSVGAEGGDEISLMQQPPKIQWASRMAAEGGAAAALARARVAVAEA